jgi:hypothetical protein
MWFAMLSQNAWSPPCVPVGGAGVVGQPRVGAGEVLDGQLGFGLVVERPALARGAVLRHPEAGDSGTVLPWGEKTSWDSLLVTSGSSLASSRR